MDETGTLTLGNKLVEQLYTEAMLLADDARAYFDVAASEQRPPLPPSIQVGVACESLKLTTRLMQVIAWLLTQRAIAAGEIAADAPDADARRLGDAPDSDPEMVAHMPDRARTLVEQSLDLYARTQRLEAGQGQEPPTQSPARSLLQRLQRAF